MQWRSRILILAAMLALCAGGCATTRKITIYTTPADASIKIDGVDKGQAPVTYEFTWENDAAMHNVVAERLGYVSTAQVLRRDYDRDDLTINLPRFHRRVVINVVPPPAVISVDGHPLQADPMMSASTDLEFNVDARNNWSTHTLTAERFGYEPVSVIVTHADRDNTYVLQMLNMHKNLVITTDPPGASVYLDNEAKGVSPLTIPDVNFLPDANGTDWEPRLLKITKAGYDAVEQQISWDAGNTDYALRFVPKTKAVRFVTDPPAAVVTVDGQELPRDSSGASSAKLTFPAVNDQGDLKTYTVTIGKKTDTQEWVPKTMKLTWDGGQTEYPVGLKEVLTRPVPLLTAAIDHTDSGWTITPRVIGTIGMKDVDEGPHAPPPVQITRLPKGTMIDTLAVSPDGSQILLTVLSGRDRGDFRSQMMLIHADGTGGADYASDGKSLDLMPSFSPAGDQILFASNRFGSRMSLCAIAANGSPGVTQLTSDNNNALWPCLDSDPSQRLWYETLVDSRTDPRIYRAQLNSTLRTDLTAGAQPRVSPRNDAIAFTQVNEKTGNRDIFRISDKGLVAENLTNNPDSDQYDAVWSKDGGRLAFVSDRGVDEEGRRNADIWVLDLNHGQTARQITHNGSRDDCPAFDPSGNFIYFRSNRGGDWQIWRIPAR